MKKLAIFVEGQTEQIFLQSFIEEIASKREIVFDCKTLRAGTLISLKQKQCLVVPDDPKFFVLLVNCQNDEKVKSVVLEQRDSLMKKGYTLILGLRDLYPTPYSDLDKIKANLKYRVPTLGVPTHIILAVSEIEAWFLQEHLHFNKINSGLNPMTFKEEFGFDPFNDCAELVEHPTELLHTIYKSVGMAYKKDRKRVERTVNKLDYAQLYLATSDQLPHLAEFVGHVEHFLTI